MALRYAHTRVTLFAARYFLIISFSPFSLLDAFIFFAALMIFIDYFLALFR